MMSYILLFLISALFGFGVFVAIYPEKLPVSWRPYARDFNKWRGNLTYDQVLWTASLMLALSQSKTLSSLGGPFESFRLILERISRFFYNIAGDWMVVTMKKEDKL